MCVCVHVLGQNTKMSGNTHTELLEMVVSLWSRSVGMKGILFYVFL